MPREELEAALRARPDDATLHVYADLLQAQGDPRGELIALDLRGVRDYKRRGQLLTAWLGDVALAWSAAQEQWYAGDLDGTHATFAYGFVDLHVVEADYPPRFVAHLLDGAAGTYLRRLWTAGSPALLAHVALRERPWLQHLAIARARKITEPLPHEALVAATPNLEVLDVSGRHVFDAFAHPNLRELGVVGSEAIHLVDGPPFPALHAIDFAFDAERPTPRGLFSQARFPALRRVSFERCEPAGRLHEQLGMLGVRETITQLVLPSLRTEREHALAQAAIDRMPRLREITIARAYACHPIPQLRHATARIAFATPFPWPPRDELAARPLVIDGYPTSLRDLVDALELQYDTLPDELQAIASRFFHVVVGLDGEHTFAARDLVQLLDALDMSSHLQSLRDHLHDRLRQRAQFLAALHW